MSGSAVTLVAVSSLSDFPQGDALVVVCESLDSAKSSLAKFSPEAVALLEKFAKVDAAIGRATSVAVGDGVPGSRLIIAPTGPINREFDDARRAGAAAASGIKRAQSAGSTSPLLLIAVATPSNPLPSTYLTSDPSYSSLFARCGEVAILSAIEEIYVPLQAREAGKSSPITQIGVLGFAPEAVKIVESIAAGVSICRDIDIADPERGTPQLCVDLIRRALGDESRVKIHVETDLSEYPLAAAVGRASMQVSRHKPCIVRLEYQRDGDDESVPTDLHLLFAGKGIVYDTGGADLKTGGIMAGMSRDKGGAASIVGFIKSLALLDRLHLVPNNKKIHVVAELAFVRNSVGSDCYVSDEIILSHGGARVKVGNTDAEGRMVLADCLSHLRVRAMELVTAQPNADLLILSVATLTGHATRAVGRYSIVLENGPMRQWGVARKLQEHGDVWGDPWEISRLRPEDFAFIQPKEPSYDVLQCNTAPSTMTKRGHQFPAAFLQIASGLVSHSIDATSVPPLRYCHCDIGGSAQDDDDYPTGRPVRSFVAAFVLGK